MDSSTALISEYVESFQSEEFSVQDTAGLYGLHRTECRSWLSATERKIRKLGELMRGWDSYGANPIDIRSIKMALQFVGDLARVSKISEPAISATPSGHVALIWSWESGTRELEIKVLSTGELQFCLSDDVDPKNDRQGSTRLPEQIVTMLTMR